jgi:hypothetical protein
VRRGLWVMFAVYCLLASTSWLVAPVSENVRGLVFEVVGIAAVVVNGRRPWGSVGGVVRVAVGAVMVVGVPEVVSGLVERHVGSNLETAVLALIPAMVVLVAAQVGVGESEAVWRLMAPALAGLGGFLLVVPLGFPRSVVGWVSFVVLIGSAELVAVAGVSMYRLLRGFSGVQAVAIFCLANAVVLLGVGVFEGSGWGMDGMGWISAGVVAGEAVLLAVLLQGMEPVRLGARFLAIPLVTIVEGVVVVRPEVSWRVVVGVGLMVGAVAMLVGSRRVAEVSSLSLR